MISLLLACARGPLIGLDAPEPELRLYEVQFGDSLWGIAERYAVAGGFSRLAALNGIANPHYIEAGWHLKVPTAYDDLPPWPTVRPNREAPEACPGTPVGAGAPATITGCVTATCVSVSALDRVCACDTGEGANLSSYRGGQRGWTHAVATAPSDWTSGPTERQATDLVATRHQLDADAAPELIVAWRIEENDLAMSRWQLAVFDEPLSGAAPAVFEVANYGPGTVAAGDRCEIMATEWLYTREPTRRSDGWYLTARRFTWNEGALHPTDDPVTSRRLTHAYQPGTTRLGAARFGTPAADLARSWTRSTDPVVAWRRVADRPTTTTADLLVAARRLGDRATGIVYPPGYRPAWWPVGKEALVSSYQPKWWMDPWSVIWL